MKGFELNLRPLELLTESQVDRIHRGSLDVLSKAGVRFESGYALELFRRNGCKVDFQTMRVKFPERLVEECLRECPSSYRVRTRSPEHDLVLGGTRIHFFGFPGMQTVDLDTWEPRKPTRQEYYDLITVLDALENHHIFTPYPYFGFEGIPEVMSIPEGIAAILRNSDKGQIVAYQKESEIFAIEMARVAGTELVGGCGASSPLTYYEDAVQAARRFAEAGFPVAVASGCIHGATGPATIAGSLLIDNAELMAGIALVQLIEPGTRVITNNFTFSQNMRSGSPNFGGIESALHLVGASQLARMYRIPKWSGTSGLSSSKTIDFQCGYEKGMTALLAAVSGYTLVQLHGGIYGELTAHPVQAILDDDVAGLIGRFVQGLEVTDETLAVELIQSVGPIPGYYTNTEHTRKWWKKEQFIPRVADRLGYPDEWRKKGKTGALDNAKERMTEILATHKVKVPLSQGQDEEIEKILQDARMYYKEKDLL